MNRRVLITGVGAVTPLGVGAETLHRGWLAGRSGLGVRTIRDLEQGRAARPRSASVGLLADALGIRTRL